MSGEGGPIGVDLQVGAALARLRQSAGFSRDRLAVVLDVSQQSLQAWEAAPPRQVTSPA